MTLFIMFAAGIKT